MPCFDSDRSTPGLLGTEVTSSSSTTSDTSADTSALLPVLPPQKLKHKSNSVGLTMASHAAVVPVSPIHLSVRSRIVKAMLLLSISAHSFGKAVAFQPLRISRTRTITTTRFSLPRFLSTQLPMSSSIEQERKVPVNSLRSFRSSSSQQQQNDNDSDSDTLVLDPLIVCGPSGVGTC
jgi:hypothetical protein